MSQKANPEAPVPVGLEQLLLLAGVDDNFAEVLRSRPAEAVDASGVTLTEVERRMLQSVPSAQLEQMARGVTQTAPEPTRRVFMGLASAALATLGVGAVAGCGKKSGKSSAEKNAPVSDQMGTMAQKRQEELRRHREPAPPTGIRPGPRVSSRRPVIVGPMDKRKARQQLALLFGQVRTCWLSKGQIPRRIGWIRLDLTVDAAGKVTAATIGEGKLQDNIVVACILEAARKLSFPPSKPKPSSIQVRYDFSFR